MTTQNNILVIRQLDRRLASWRPLLKTVPVTGWISLMRKTLHMSLRQFGDKLSITAQGVKNLEKREADGTITLNALKEAAGALDMEVVYLFLPKDESLEKMIERKAHNMAESIINRTSVTMKLEDQENSKDRIKQAIEELTDEIKREMPRSLWD